VAPTQLTRLVERAPKDDRLRVWVEGQTIEGKNVKKGVLLPLGDPGPVSQRLRKIGLTLMTLGDEVRVGGVGFGSTAEKLGLEQGFVIKGIEVDAERPDKEWMFVPALLLLGLIIARQRARRENAPAQAKG